MQRKAFVKPELQIVLFSPCDVITVSPVNLPILPLDLYDPDEDLYV